MHLSMLSSREGVGTNDGSLIVGSVARVVILMVRMSPGLRFWSYEGHSTTFTCRRVGILTNYIVPGEGNLNFFNESKSKSPPHARHPPPPPSILLDKILNFDCYPKTLSFECRFWISRFTIVNFKTDWLDLRRLDLGKSYVIYSIF